MLIADTGLLSRLHTTNSYTAGYFVSRAQRTSHVVVVVGTFFAIPFAIRDKIWLEHQFYPGSYTPDQRNVARKRKKGDLLYPEERGGGIFSVTRTETFFFFRETPYLDTLSRTLAPALSPESTDMYVSRLRAVRNKFDDGDSLRA